MDGNGANKTPPTNVLSPKFTPKHQTRAGNMQRTVDEMRQHIAKLKSELDTEKTRSKQLHRDKVSEIRSVRESGQREKEQAIDSLTAKMEHQRHLEVQRMREQIIKEKDQEIRSLHKLHEEEIRDQKSHFSIEKEDSIMVALEMQKHALGGDAPGSPSPQRPVNHSALVIKLQREIKQLKEEKVTMEAKLTSLSDENKSRKSEVGDLAKKHSKEISSLKEQLQKEISQFSETIQQEQILNRKLQTELEQTRRAVENSVTGSKSNDDEHSRNRPSTNQKSPGSQVATNSITDKTAETHSQGKSGAQQTKKTHSEIGGANQTDIHSNKNSPLDVENVSYSSLPQGALKDNCDSNIASSSLVPDRHTASQSTSQSPSQADKSEGLSQGSGRSGADQQNLEHKRLHEEKESRDKERVLQKKISELTSQLNKLEKRVSLLKSENETLKKKTSTQEVSEEKIKKLKKRNAELAAIARRLEEKAKQLQTEQNVKRRESLGQEGESVRKSFTRQRVRELSDSGQKMAEKERELDVLRHKCEQLTTQLTTTAHSYVPQIQQPMELQELENIIKRAAKERLKLERQVLEPLNQNTEQEVEKIKSLEDSNQALKKEVECLLAAVVTTEKLEIEVTQKRIECETLNKDVQESRQRCHVLEGELQEVIEKNTQLTIQNSDLQQRISQLEKVNEECIELRRSLAEVQSECENSQAQVNSLTDTVHRLQHDVQRLQEEVSEKETLKEQQKQLLEQLEEREKTQSELTEQLSDRDQQVVMLQQARHTSDVQHQGAVSGLQNKLAELERRYQLQEAQHSQLSEDMERLRRQLPQTHGAPGRSEGGAVNGYRRTTQSLNTVAPPGEESIDYDPKEQPIVTLDDIYLTPGEGYNNTEGQIPDSLGEKHEEGDIEGQESQKSVGRIKPGNKKFERNSTMDDIDSLEESYEEDFEEQEEEVVTARRVAMATKQEVVEDKEEVKEDDRVDGRSEEVRIGVAVEVEQNERVFDDSLEREHEGKQQQEMTLARTGSFELIHTSHVTSQLEHSAKGLGEGALIAPAVEDLNSLDPSRSLGQDDLELRALAKKIDALSVDSDGEGDLVDDDERPGSSQSSVDENLNQQDQDEANNNRALSEERLNAMETSMSMKKSPFQVFVAKYHYDPQQFSPNENPDQELVLNIGDYIFVYGEMDEDGFFEGELMDGRRGLVPSNFVEKVPDEELEEFHSNLGLRHHDDSGSLHQDFEFNSSDEAASKFNLDNIDSAQRPTSNRPASNQASSNQARPVGTELVEVSQKPAEKRVHTVAVEVANSGIPGPVNLKLERELHNSVLISWSPPLTTGIEIQSYHVCVNKQLKTSVKGTERTKALLEGINLRQAHQVSVRTVTNRGQSTDAACVMTVGKDASHAPSDLVVTNVTSTSALVTWLPSSSSYQHILAVNGRDIMVTNPGCFNVGLSGMEADKTYKVTITTCVDDTTVAVHKATSCTFRTLEGGIPDAPLDVQVESGPQEGTLLVTWLPVTITTSGKSNGAIVTGYSIYIDGRKVQQMPSPTGDHTVLESKHLTSLQRTPQAITIRTVAKDDTESPDSQPAVVNEPLRQELTRKHGTMSLATTSPQTDDQKLRHTFVNMDLTPSPSKASNISLVSNASSSNHSNASGRSKSSGSGNDSFLMIDQSGRSEKGEVNFTAAQPVMTPAPQKKPFTGVTKVGMELDQPLPEELRAGSLEAELLEAQEAESEIPHGGDDDLGDSELSDIAEVDEEDDTPRSQTHPQKMKTARVSLVEEEVPPRKTSSPRMKSPRNAMNDGKPFQNVPEHSPRMVPTKIIKDGHQPYVAFRPVQEDELDSTTDHSGQVLLQQSSQMSVPHIQITKDSSGSVSDDISPEKQLNDARGQGHSRNKYHHHRDTDSPKTEHPQRRPKSVPGGGGYHGDSRHGSPPEGDPTNSSNRPKSAKVPGGRKRDHPSATSGGGGPNVREKKRDYFEKHEIENHEKYGGDNNSRRGGGPSGINGHHQSVNKSYDEDSITSYSALEDNNKITRHRIQDDLTMSELIDYEDDGGDSLIESVPDLEYDETRVRIFIALFDYNPTYMSPNPDAADEELPFKEGQLIKIFGEKDPDGFFMGEANGRRGMVPCNMVSEVQVDDPDIAQQLLRESNRAASSHLSSRGVSRNDSRGPNSRGPSRGDPPRQNGLGRPHPGSPHRSPRSSHSASPYTGDLSQPRRMVAMYDYDPQELSPNVDVDVELPFRSGDIVWVFGEMDEDGFFYSEVSGRRGLVPSNFLQEAPLSHDQYENRHGNRQSNHHGNPASSAPTRHAPPEHAQYGVRGPPGYPPQYQGGGGSGPHHPGAGGPPPPSLEHSQRDYPHPGAPHGGELLRDPKHQVGDAPRRHSGQVPRPRSREPHSGNPGPPGHSPHRHAPREPRDLRSGGGVAQGHPREQHNTREREGRDRQDPRDTHGIKDHHHPRHETSRDSMRSSSDTREPRELRDPRDEKYRVHTPDSGSSLPKTEQNKDHQKSAPNPPHPASDIDTSQTEKATTSKREKTPSGGSAHTLKPDIKPVAKSPAIEKKKGLFSKGKTIWKKISK